MLDSKNFVMDNVISIGFVALFISWFFAKGILGETDALTAEIFFSNLYGFWGTIYVEIRFQR